LGGYYKKLSDFDTSGKYKNTRQYALMDSGADSKVKNQAQNGAIIAKDKNFKALTLL